MEDRKSKKRVTSKGCLFHHHHPNFYDFFLRAIAPFTGYDDDDFNYNDDELGDTLLRTLVKKRKDSKKL